MLILQNFQSSPPSGRAARDNTVANNGRCWQRPLWTEQMGGGTNSCSYTPKHAKHPLHPPCVNQQQPHSFVLRLDLESHPWLFSHTSHPDCQQTMLALPSYVFRIWPFLLPSPPTPSPTLPSSHSLLTWFILNTVAGMIPRKLSQITSLVCPKLSTCPYLIQSERQSLYDTQEALQDLAPFYRLCVCLCAHTCTVLSVFSLMCGQNGPSPPPLF